MRKNKHFIARANSESKSFAINVGYHFRLFKNEREAQRPCDRLYPFTNRKVAVAPEFIDTVPSHNCQYDNHITIKRVGGQHA